MTSSSLVFIIVVQILIYRGWETELGSAGERGELFDKNCKLANEICPSVQANAAPQKLLNKLIQ